MLLISEVDRTISLSYSITILQLSPNTTEHGLPDQFRVRAPPETRDLFSRKRGCIAHILSFSLAHRPDIIEILLKKDVKSRHQSIFPIMSDG